MRRRDRRKWAEARSLGDLAALTCEWLDGGIRETPGHCGPPCPETIPLIPLLRRVNQAGFVTENSSPAYPGSGAWLLGFAAPYTCSALAAGLDFGLVVREAPAGVRAEVLHFYLLACPLAGDALRHAAFLEVADLVQGRPDDLWHALAAFAQDQLA